MFDALSAGAAAVLRRPLFSALVVVAAGQALMNAAYGYQYWGGGDFSAAALVFGVVYLGLEGVKLAAAHEAGARLRGGALWSGAGLFAVGLLTLYFSFQAHVGFIGSFRNDQMAGREAAIDQRDTTRQQLTEARKARATIGTVRAVGAIGAEEKLECAKTSRRYPTGEGPECTKLRAELAEARRAGDLDKRIAALAGKRISTGAVGVADPQQKILDWISGASADDKKLMLTIWAALAIELTTFFGFFLAGEHSREPETLAGMMSAGLISHPGAQQVIDFKAQVLEPARGASVSEDDIWAAYEAWATRSSGGGIQRAALMRLLEQTPIRRRDGRFVGVAIRPAVFLRTVS